MRAKRITGGWADQRTIREIMVFLQSHGVGTSRAVRIFKTYGGDAITIVLVAAPWSPGKKDMTAAGDRAVVRGAGTVTGL